MDVDSINFDVGVAADDNDSDGEPTNASQDIIVDIRDMIGFKRWRGQRKYKGPTWKEHLCRFNNAWGEIMDELVEEFIQWKYPTLAQSPTEESNGWEFTVDVVDIHSLVSEVTIY